MLGDVDRFGYKPCPDKIMTLNYCFYVILYQALGG